MTRFLKMLPKVSYRKGISDLSQIISAYIKILDCYPTLIIYIYRISG